MMRSISVIIPVYNESDNLDAMYQALAAIAAAESSLEWEFLFVEDGSTDGTFSVLTELNQADPRVKIVQLSRNYGYHVAAAAGLQFASGDAAVIIAGDLQDHPREIRRFLSKWREGFHVVWGVRATGQDSRVNRLLSGAFSFLVRYVALPTYPPQGTGSFCLLDRKVVDALNHFPERNRMTFGLVICAGFRQTQVEYNRLARHAGTSKFTVRRKIRHAIDVIVTFSSFPIRLTSTTGFVIAVLSFAYTVYLALNTIIYARAPEGWTSIIAIVLMLGGVQLMVLGVLGEYLWRVCDEVRQRPLFLVQELRGKFLRVNHSFPNKPTSPEHHFSED
jgi:glycosyltransferase involved in cell wall biosynthesis